MKTTLRRIYNAYKSFAPILTIILTLFAVYFAWEQNRLNKAHSIHETRRMFIDNSIEAITEISSSVSSLARTGKELTRKASALAENLDTNQIQSNQKLLLDQDIQEILGDYYRYWEEIRYKTITNQHRMPNRVIDLYQKFWFTVAFEGSADMDLWNEDFKFEVRVDSSTAISVSTNDRDVLLYGDAFITGQFINDDEGYIREFYSAAHLKDFLQRCADMGWYTNLIQYDLLMEISNYMILAAYDMDESVQ